jgi:hypothetical protein
MKANAIVVAIMWERLVPGQAVSDQPSHTIRAEETKPPLCSAKRHVGPSGEPAGATTGTAASAVDTGA